MLFKTLMDKYLDESIKPDVETLLKMKMTMPEIGTGKPFKRINEYLYRTIEEIEKAIAELPSKEAEKWEELNQIFLKLI